MDVILGFIAFMVFAAVYAPHVAKTAAYARLKAKEREELDRKLEVEHYFGAKVIGSDEPVEIKLKKVN